MNDIDYQGLTGRVVTPNDPEYNEARQEFNRAIQKFPIAIVYCLNKHDVANAICWSRKNKVCFRIRTGGHNYAGYSTGNDVLVIDIRELNNLEFDEYRGILTIEGGVKNEQVYELVGNAGYTFPGGACPTVGVAGLTLGGGWGYSCRYLGLACDSLISLELVNYRGEIIVANGFCNPDLFWACRGGGGGNFGVVVSMTFKLVQKVGNVSYIEMYLPQATDETYEQFWNIWQNWLRGLDNRITMLATIYNSQEEGNAIYARGIFYGPEQEALQIISPYTQIQGLNINVEYIPFIDAIRRIEASYPQYEIFKSGGRFVYKDFSHNEIENMTGFLNIRPIGSIFTGISLYAIGGEVSRKNKYETAFYHRNARYIINIQSMWEDSEYAKINTRWVEDRFNYIYRITKGSYINFPYSNLKNYGLNYYGENYEALRQIKIKYDPYNAFNFPQSIK